MKYKHIVFDIDGTLLDTEKADMSSLQEVIFKTQNRKIDLSELYFAFGIPGEVALSKLGVENPKEANKLWNTLFSRYRHTIKLFDGVAEMLGELKQAGYSMGIITSKNPAEFTNDFLPFGITEYFKTIILATDSPRPKPSPDPMLAYLEKTGISADEAIYIGDTIYDMQCAKTSGADFGLAVWGCHNKERIKADYYFDSPRDILLSI